MPSDNNNTYSTPPRLIVGVSSSLLLFIVAIFLTKTTCAQSMDDGPAICHQAYVERIYEMCTYPDQTWPCLRNSRFIDGQIKHAFDIDSISAQACAGSISLNEIYENICCFSPNCLEKCYGIIPDLDNNLFIRAKLKQLSTIAKLSGEPAEVMPTRKEASSLRRPSFDDVEFPSTISGVNRQLFNKRRSGVAELGVRAPSANIRRFLRRRSGDATCPFC